MYLTEQEIMSTHEALTQTYDRMLSQKEEIEAFFRQNPQRKFLFIGCGSSYMLSKTCERLFDVRPGASAAALAGGDYLVNPGYYEELVKGSIVVALSRSGLTSEILRAVTHMKETCGVKVVSVTMKEENDLAGLSDLSVKLPWAYDNSVCQTRTVTNLYAASLLLCAFCYEDGALVRAVETAVGQNEAYKKNLRAPLEAIGGKPFRNVVVLADGPLCGLAQEGALAFTEIALVPGSFFNLLDYRHGPMVLNTKDTLTIVFVQPGEAHYQSRMIEDLKSHGGLLVTVGTGEGNPFGVDLHVRLDGIDRFEAMGIPFIYVCQMIALSKALANGTNPDAPTGLDAYITLK